jgi:hypothetical protein
VRDLEEARTFYGGLLGCAEGRSDPAWVDFDFFGHQIVAHLNADLEPTSTSLVDGHQVPVRHFGLVLDWDDWETLAERLRIGKMEFLIEPQVRFKGEGGEQATMFVTDPSGNALEFKAFRDAAQLFAK